MNMDLWNLDVDWLIIFQVLLASARFIEKIVYMNLDQNHQPISDQISKVHVHLNQTSHYIKTHEIWAKKMFGPFSSSFMRWPVVSSVSEKFSKVWIFMKALVRLNDS